MMKPLQKFTPVFKECGNKAALISLASVQKPISENRKTRLFFYNNSEYDPASNQATWQPLSKHLAQYLPPGQVRFSFHFINEGCHRVIFKIRRAQEHHNFATQLWFEVVGQGQVAHTEEKSHPNYSLLIVELGYIESTTDMWELCLHINLMHSDSVFVFQEAYLQRLS